MKRILRVIAAVLVIGSVAFWVARGANRGWTKTSVERRTVDEVTGLEGVAYEQRFVPGLDFLGAACVAALLLNAVSFFFRREKTGAS